MRLSQKIRERLEENYNNGQNLMINGGIFNSLYDSRHPLTDQMKKIKRLSEI